MVFTVSIQYNPTVQRRKNPSPRSFSPAPSLSPFYDFVRLATAHDARTMQEETLCAMAGAQSGHFVLESGYHCDRWFDLDRLFLPEQRARLQPFVADLASRLALQPIDAVCGPATGGAQLAERIGLELAVPCFSANRIGGADRMGRVSVTYRLDASAREALRGRRVALVDDAISTGSAIRHTHAELLACGALPVALGALMVFGEHAGRFALDRQLVLSRLVQLPLGLWLPADCPLCGAGG